MERILSTIALLVSIPLLAQRPLPAACCTHAPNLPGHVNKDRPIGAKTAPSTADLRVVPTETSVDSTPAGTYTLRTAIEVAYPGGNNCADSASAFAIISLPQYSVVREVNATSASGKKLSVEQCKAQLWVKLSSLCPNKGKDKISVTVDRAPKGSGADCQPAFSVFTFSGMPDFDPTNNYWWWRRQCPKDSWQPGAPVWGPR